MNGSESSTRRRFLAGVSGVGAFGLAGCAGVLSNEDDESSAPEATSTEMTSAVTTSTETTLPTPVLGDPDAEVTVMAFEDYACGHCASYSLEHFPKLASEYIEPGLIRYEHHEFPLPLSNASWRAPNAARAVQDTVGEDAYWTYSKLLFTNQRQLGPSMYAKLAEEVGADTETVKSAAVERRYDPTIKADKRKGKSLGVKGTPAIFVNGSSVDNYAFETISQAIEEQR